MRADTSSAATVERYRQLSIEYFEHFEHIKDAEPARTYSLSVDATKSGDALTRALALNGNTINATWATGEKVYVYAPYSTTVFWFEGNLEAKSAGTTTQLNGAISLPTGWEGTVDSYVSYPYNFTLQFPHPGNLNYSGQKGTLTDIAENYDYAIATNVQFEVKNNYIKAINSATFVNQQAIVKFTLVEKNNETNVLSPLMLTINYGSDNISLTSIPDATYSTNGAGVLYVAIPGFSGNITLSATCADGTYTKTTATTFQNGEYYDITVKMTKQ